ncbi:AfsR/SARP family transcriptional regulator [Plantactinospora soyae]|uniref:DNA-binding SARP family transcriptional activator/tetratricopeptide (TPR) repeat protein n=1 Tax=Plantactinospora soyae TaxID=1544732 RepID=A0A927M877_9ACTN|nr:BTAD domain-containing putative transcriptional regulator [Plantactinospora soyae]MBE1489589.1 DNA-binding SARP family transcriptional activator/tetratricopeptide (TPR) repeat protein [Plantactinospora soyae]
MITFGILGAIRAWRDGVEIELGPPQQRALLGLLLAEAGQPVGTGTITEMLWGDNPPSTAANLIHRYVSGLRRILEPDLPARVNGTILARQVGGYRIVVSVDALDLASFRQLREQAGRHVEAGEPGAAVEAYVAALRLWRGPCAADVRTVDRVPLAFTAADHEYLAAAQEAAQFGLRSDLGHECLGEVRRAAAFDPLNESIQACLVRLLAATGRRAEALAAYRNTRRRLTDELGIDPGPDLQEAQRLVLQEVPADEVRPAEPPGPHADPGVPAGPDPAKHATADTARPLTRLAQLPADLPVFVGRRTELAQASLLLADLERSGGVTVVAVDGMPGVGKTALAVHLAHCFASRFPDGQLYVNLRGFDPDGRTVGPAGALAGLLQALGVPAKDLPAELDDRAALYRSVLAQRRVLVVIDNARDAAQVRPLLPGSTTCLAIVTSRDRLTGLTVTHGARPMRVPLFELDQAREYLIRRLDRAAVAAAPAVLDEIAERCGRLPLALAVVAARAAHDVDLPLTSVVAELRAAEGSLDAFAGADAATNARVVFSWSYRALEPGVARLFRLLSLHPGSPLTLPAAASLLGVSAREARGLLAALAQAHLAGEAAAGEYTCHDLLRAYAGELSAEHDSDAARDQARHRLLDHYVHTAVAAAVCYSASRPPIALPTPAPGVNVTELTTPEQASAWLDSRYRLLLDLVTSVATDRRFDPHVWQLTWALNQFLYGRGLWHEQLALSRTALAAAQRLADPVALGHMHSVLARALANLGQLTEAGDHMRQALDLFTDTVDDDTRAEQHRAFSWVLEQQGRYDLALSHAEQALGLLKTAGTPARRAMALNAVGWYHALLGQHQSALCYCQQALALLEEAGEQRSQADVWDSIGYAHHHSGEPGAAVEAYQRAIQVWRELGVRYAEADTLVRLGEAYRAAGDDTAAVGAWRQALTVLEELNHPDVVAVQARLGVG